MLSLIVESPQVPSGEEISYVEVKTIYILFKNNFFYMKKHGFFHKNRTKNKLWFPFTS